MDVIFNALINVGPGMVPSSDSRPGHLGFESPWLHHLVSKKAPICSGPFLIPGWYSDSRPVKILSLINAKNKISPIGKASTQRLLAIFLLLFWCPERDSNSHELPH